MSLRQDAGDAQRKAPVAPRIPASSLPVADFNVLRHIQVQLDRRGIDLPPAAGTGREGTGLRMIKTIDRRKHLLLWYSISFCVFFSGFFMVFFLSGKSMLWQDDGFNMYFPNLYYIGAHLRDFFAGVLKGDFSFRMFDFTLGMGDDVRGAVMRIHPDSLLAVLVPGAGTEVFYHFLIFFRLYVAGLCFLAYTSYQGISGDAALLGCMVYLFNGHTMKQCTQHPNFILAMIVLPLLFIGAEKVMRERKYTFFIIVSALGFICTYYFMYMCSIALILYVLLRFPFCFRTDRLRAFFGLFFRMGGAYLLAIALSACSLLPTVLHVRSSYRLDSLGGFSQLLWYKDSPQRFYRWFLDLITPYVKTGAATNLNFAVIAVPAMVILLCRAGKDKKKTTVQLLAVLVLESLMIIIPVGAYVMNGFSGTSNRWIFVFCFTIGFLCAFMAGSLCSLSKKESIILWCAAGCYAAVSAVDFMIFGNAIYLISTAQLLAFTAFLTVPALKKLRCMPALLAVVFVSCLVNGVLSESSIYGNYAGEFMDLGESMKKMQDSEFSMLSEIEDDGWYRVDSSLSGLRKENYSEVLGFRGIAEFNSILNRNLIISMLGQDQNGLNALIRIYGLDGRTGAEALAGVKYYLTDRDGEAYVPYGFERIETDEKTGAELYINKYPLPFGISYDSWIRRSEYDTLSPVAKNRLLLGTAVIEDAALADAELQAAAGNLDEKETALRLQQCEDMLETIPLPLPEDKTIAGTLEYPITYREGCETCLVLKGLSRRTETDRIQIATSRIEKMISYRGAADIYSLGDREYAVNLGYSDRTAEDILQIKCKKEAEYALDSAAIVYVPLAGYEEAVAGLMKDGLENTVFMNNRVAGKTSSGQSRIMMFSMPFKDGWDVFVDGEKGTLLNVNDGYTGVFLAPGEHDILLKYCSPGLVSGRLISLGGLVIWLFITVAAGRKKKKHETG